MSRIPKERTIFTNYYSEERFNEARNFLFDEYGEDNRWETVDDIPDSEVFEQLTFDEEICWGDTLQDIDNFDSNSNSYYIMVGEVGRWNGIFAGGKIFKNLLEAIYYATEDCNLIEIYDENGQFKICCSHHDGSNSFLIKEITDKGLDYLSNWENNWDDERTEQYVHNQIIKRYSHNLNYVHKVWGCPMREYEKQTKEKV